MITDKPMEGTEKKSKLELRIGQLKKDPKDFTYSTVQILPNENLGFGSIPQSEGPVKIIEIKDDPAIKPLHCIITHHERSGIFITPSYEGCECYIEAQANKWSKIPNKKLIIGSTKIKLHRISPSLVKVTMKDNFKQNIKSCLMWEIFENIIIGRCEPEHWDKFIMVAGGRPVNMIVPSSKDLFMSKQHIILTCEGDEYYVYPVTKNPTYLCCGEEGAFVKIGQNVLLGSLTLCNLSQ
jgi:hypothetical protein